MCHWECGWLYFDVRICLYSEDPDLSSGGNGLADGIWAFPCFLFPVYRSLFVVCCGIFFLSMLMDWMVTERWSIGPFGSVGLVGPFNQDKVTRRVGKAIKEQQVKAVARYSFCTNGSTDVSWFRSIWSIGGLINWLIHSLIDRLMLMDGLLGKPPGPWDAGVCTCQWMENLVAETPDEEQNTPRFWFWFILFYCRSSTDPLEIQALSHDGRTDEHSCTYSQWTRSRNFPVFFSLQKHSSNWAHVCVFIIPQGLV